ncbi:FHA domain-containing protein, partial [Streptomyces antimicrobicus]
PGFAREADAFGYQDSRPSRVNRPAEPLVAEGEDDWLLQPPTPGPAPSAAPASASPVATAPAPVPAPAPAPALGPASYERPVAPSAPTPPPVPRPSGPWTATIGPDRDYFTAMMRRSGPEAAGLDLPAYAPEQHLTLSGGQITIGRRRASATEGPDIDLSVPPEDPGVSHRHAVLVQQPDGSWAVVDQNSTNGTTINGGEDPIQPYVPVQLSDGDRVHVGAWTTITVRRDRA